MPSTHCGFKSIVGGATGAVLLAGYGPTLFVDIGFDPNFKIGAGKPIPGITGVDALVDTGAAECCIDSMLATQLNLPIVDRRPMSGSAGQHEVNIHLAQIHVPSLAWTMYGRFAAVHLAAGGQIHKALMGRTFLATFKMIYDGVSGMVVISSEPLDQIPLALHP